MSYESERIEKQMFLKAEIIEKNFDASDFIGFCDNIREGGGTNVDVWTFPELKEIVRKFQEKFANPVYEEEEKSYESEIHQQKDYDCDDSSDGARRVVPSDTNTVPSLNDFEKIEKVEKVTPLANQDASKLEEPKKVDKMESNFKITGNSQFGIKQQNPSTYERQINCKPLQRMIFEEKLNEIEIDIVDVDVKEGGFLSASYVVYKIVTKPLKWEVTRRYSDFDWLRGILVKMNPGCFIPPIPNKKIGKKFDSLFLNKRKAFLTKFLNDIIKSPNLRNNRIVYEFLSQTDDLNFKVKKNDADALKKPLKLDQISNFTGKVNLTINDSLNNYSVGISNYLDLSYSLYQKMGKLSKQLLLDLDGASSTLFQMGETFANLYNLSNHFNNHASEGRNPNLDDVYVTMNNVCFDWGKAIVKEMQVVQDSLCNFFKYQKHFNFGLGELLRERDSQYTEYLKFKEKLNAKKEKLFAQGDINKWDLPAARTNAQDLLQNKPEAMKLMLHKETEIEMSLKDKFAFYNHHVNEEIKVMLEHKCNKYMEHFSNFGKSQSKIIKDLHEIWADIVSHFENKDGGRQIPASTRRISFVDTAKKV